MCIAEDLLVLSGMHPGKAELHIVIAVRPGEIVLGLVAAPNVRPGPRSDVVSDIVGAADVNGGNSCHSIAGGVLLHAIPGGFFIGAVQANGDVVAVEVKGSLIQ